MTLHHFKTIYITLQHFTSTQLNITLYHLHRTKIISLLFKINTEFIDSLANEVTILNIQLTLLPTTDQVVIPTQLSHIITMVTTDKRLVVKEIEVGC